MGSDRSTDHHIIRELLTHGVAFLLAAATGAVILHRFYWFFEWNTESPSAAREAFLASLVVLGGIGQAITLVSVWLYARIWSSRNP
jgi:hypothetical protein